MRHSRVITGLLVLFCSCISTAVLEAQMITAHRGASHDAPENTMAAFRLAWAQSADAIEGDFYLTADDEIVCIHDPDTKRTGDSQHIVERSTLEDLRGIDVGAWKHAKFQGERIPLFAEVYATVTRDKRFVIELKSKAKIVPVLMRQLDELDANPEQLLIISFDADSIAKCKALRPDIPAHWLTSFKTDASQQFVPSVQQIAATVQRCRADGVGMKGDTAVINEAFVAQLKAAGCREFHVWTVDDAKQAHYFRSLGAMGITTNRPGFIREALANEVIK